MKKLFILLTAALLSPFPGLNAAENSTPNIVYILADDLGPTNNS